MRVTRPGIGFRNSAMIHREWSWEMEPENVFVIWLVKMEI